MASKTVSIFSQLLIYWITLLGVYFCRVRLAYDLLALNKNRLLLLKERIVCKLTFCTRFLLTDWNCTLLHIDCSSARWQQCAYRAGRVWVWQDQRSHKPFKPEDFRAYNQRDREETTSFHLSRSIIIAIIN